jgi:carboxypeptidase D
MKSSGDAACSAFHFAVLDEFSSKSVVPFHPRTSGSYRFIEYSVNGTSIPEVEFDIGESYAGLVPISKTGNDSQLYFWLFPSENLAVSDEILIWLNGGVSF